MVTVVYYERPLHCHSTCRRDRLVCPSDHKRLRRDLSVSASFPRSQLGPDLRLHWSLPPPHWTHKWKPVQCSPDPTETHTMTMTILNCLQFLKLKWAAHQSVTFLLTQLPELSSLWPLLWPLLWSLFGLSFNLSFDLSLASPWTEALLRSSLLKLRDTTFHFCQYMLQGSNEEDISIENLTRNSSSVCIAGGGGRDEDILREEKGRWGGLLTLTWHRTTIKQNLFMVLWKRGQVRPRMRRYSCVIGF